MFELPAGKRVRREELRSPSRSSSPSSQTSDNSAAEALRERLRSRIDVDYVEVAPASHDAIGAVEAQPEEDETTFAFKLFASTRAPGKDELTAEGSAQPEAVAVDASDNPKVQYISLDDATSATVIYPQPTRPLSYYIAPTPTPCQQAQYASAAIDAASVLRFSHLPRPGLAYPWRIIPTPGVLSRSLLNTTAHTSTDSETESRDQTPHKRIRLGKKARIKKRIKIQVKLTKEQQKKEAEKAKEAHLLEKKKRLNRIKQIRKREKARLAKEGGAGGEGGESVVSGKDGEDMEDEGSE